MRVIVMDGTATGILGTLPNFNRPSVLMEPAKNTSSTQFLVHSTGVRIYLDYRLNSPKMGITTEIFESKLPRARHSDNIIRLLSGSDDSICVRGILCLLFDINNFIAQLHPVVRLNSTRETTLQIRHLVPSANVHRYCLDCLRLILCASLPLSREERFFLWKK